MTRHNVCMLLSTTPLQFVSKLSTDALHPYGGRVIIGGSLNCKRDQLELALFHALLPRMLCTWKMTHGTEHGNTYQVRAGGIESGVQSKTYVVFGFVQCSLHGQ